MSITSLVYLWSVCLLGHGSPTPGVPVSAPAASHRVEVFHFNASNFRRDDDLENILVWGVLNAYYPEGDSSDGESFEACALNGYIPIADRGPGTLSPFLLPHQPTSPFTVRSPVLRC